MNSLLLAVIVALLLQPPAHAQTAEVGVAGPSGEQRITAADLASMPRVTVTIDDHGTKATFEGVELRHRLQKAGALGEALRGKDLTRYVIVEAADGYRVLLALAELDAGFSDDTVILADKQDGNRSTQRSVRSASSLRVTREWAARPGKSSGSRLAPLNRGSAVQAMTPALFHASAYNAAFIAR